MKMTEHNLAIDQQLDQLLGFWAGDEGALVGFESKLPKIPLAEHILDGLAGSNAHDPPSHRFDVLIGKIIMEVELEIESPTFNQPRG